MATLIPPINPADIPYDSERLVLQALEGLPDSYRVLHSYPWLRPNRCYTNEPLSEGEADFVILHPERGMLVLEVKGGEPRLQDRQWYRGSREMRDPFEQARRNRYALLDAIEARSGRRILRGMFTHGDLIVFPHSRFQGTLPLNAEPRIVVDAHDLSTLPTHIEGAFAAWERQSNSLSNIQFSQLLDALLPKLRLYRCAGSELSLEKQKIVQVTQDQQATLFGLLASSRVITHGGAGSGKTLLAMEFACELAQEGSRVLFLCYNRNLATWLNEQLTIRVPADSKAQGLITISTFHAFALGLAKKAHVEVEDPDDAGDLFWEEEVPMILEQAIEVLRTEGRSVEFDVVIVDEAQDFAKDWWVTVESLTQNGRHGRLYAFLDLHQSLRKTPEEPPIEFDSKFELLTNCRNTRTIARSAASLAGVSIRLLPGIPEGELPSVRRTPSRQTEAGLILNELRSLIRQHALKANQIALIGPSSLQNSVLSGHGPIEGLPFVSDAARWRRGDGILVTTARAFKGLEADVVIIYGLSNFSHQFTPIDLYVAWTRARHRLMIFCHGEEARNVVEGALGNHLNPLTLH